MPPARFRHEPSRCRRRATSGTPAPATPRPLDAIPRRTQRSRPLATGERWTMTHGRREGERRGRVSGTRLVDCRGARVRLSSCRSRFISSTQAVSGTRPRARWARGTRPREAEKQRSREAEKQRSREAATQIRRVADTRISRGSLAECQPGRAPFSHWCGEDASHLRRSNASLPERSRGWT